MEAALLTRPNPCRPKLLSRDTTLRQRGEPAPGTEGPSRKQRKEPVNLELIVGLPQVDEEAAPLVKAPTDVLVDVAELLLG